MENVAVLFDRYRPLIDQHSNRLAHHFKVDEDVARSESYLAFMEAHHTWEPTLSKFDTYLINRMRYRIARWIERKGGTRRYREIPVAFDAYQPTYHDVPEDRYEALSQDASDVIALALHPPVEVWSDCLFRGGSKRALRSSLRAYLIEQGWSRRRVSDAFADIAEAFEA